MIQAMNQRPTPLSARLGRLMSEYRSGLGISERQLARIVGVSKQTVSNWLRGGITPQDKHLQAIAQFFEVSEYWLEHGAVLLDGDWPVRVKDVAERLSELAPSRLEIIERLVDDWSKK